MTLHPGRMVEVTRAPALTDVNTVCVYVANVIASEAAGFVV